MGLALCVRATTRKAPCGDLTKRSGPPWRSARGSDEQMFGAKQQVPHVG